MNKKAKSSRREDKNDIDYIKILISSVLSAIIYFVILALYAGLALKSGSDSSGYMPVGMITGAVTGFLCGFIAVRPIKQKGALYGMVSGLIHALICMIVLFAVNNLSAGKGIFILSAIIVICAITGGIAAVNLKIRKKY